MFAIRFWVKSWDYLVYNNLRDFQNRWLKSLNLSPHTIKAYRQDTLSFFVFFKNHIGEELTPEALMSLKPKDIRSWLASRQETHSVRSTVRAFSATKQFFSFLIDEGILESHPFIRPPKLKNTLPRPLSQDQVFDIIDHIEGISDATWVGLRNKAFFMLLYSVGLRISEALTLDQAILKADHIVVLGKGSKQRSVPLLGDVKAAITGYLNLCPYEKSDKAPLFYGVRGKRLNVSVAEAQLQRYRELTGLPDSATPHALRHSCATHLVEDSDDLRAIQELLGHSNLSTTQLYTQVSQQKLMWAYSKAHPRKT